ncbi:MAG: DUF5305 family protein [Paenisporosarcina sp.]
MRKISVNKFKGNNKKIVFTLVVLLIISLPISVYALLKPPTTSNQITDNNLEIDTSFDYKATIKPNLLYPEGGTIDVGDTIIKNITTSIPVDLKSTIHSENEVIAKGTHEIQLVVKATDLWERSFSLAEKQTFEHKGTEISIVDSTVSVNLEEVKSFIKQVEEETGISPEQYSIEIVPNILGTITFEGKEREFQLDDKLAFQYYYDEVVLASEKTFSSVTPFTSTEVITNSFRIFGLTLPLIPVRTVSTIFSSILFIAFIYVYKNFVNNRIKPIRSQIDKINKKYGNRIISVSQKVNMDEKSIITLSSFISVLKVADEKELPIFCHKIHEDGTALYFIVDGDYVYNYETIKSTLIHSTEKGIISDNAYANG